MAVKTVGKANMRKNTPIDLLVFTWRKCKTCTRYIQRVFEMYQYIPDIGAALNDAPF